MLNSLLKIAYFFVFQLEFCVLFMFFGCPQKLQQDSTQTPTKFHGQKWFLINQ